MGFRLRKSIKILPGVRLNVSKSGVSASVGVHGLTTNIKPGRKARTTVGVPGSGVSYSVTHDDKQQPRSGNNFLVLVLWVVVIAALVGAFFPV